MSQVEGKPSRRRVFFALWPSEATRRDLLRATRAVIRRSGGRATPPGNLHVTLAFLGPVAESDLDLVVTIPSIPAPEFAIELNRLGFWRGSRVLWLGPTCQPAALLDLERSLWDALVRIGFERERRPYRAHVTLARKAKPVEQAVDSVTWPVSGLTLVESRPGARHSVYEVLRQWKFGVGRYRGGDAG